MENDHDNAYIAHILDAVKRIKRFTKGVDWNVFQRDEKTQSAVIRQLEIIGEASKQLSKNLTRQTNLPWKDIAGMRDKLIHHYVEVDIKEVWVVIQHDLDQLEAALKNQNNHP